MRIGRRRPTRTTHAPLDPTMPRIADLIVAPLLMGMLGAAAAAAAEREPTAACARQSDPQHKARVIELYTSQGCSSCPPADRWLKLIARQPASSPVYALSLHVKYWDHIGWKDPYAKDMFSARQRWLAELNHSRSVYTPGVFIDGNEWSDWYAPESMIRRLSAASARPGASINVRVDPRAQHADIDATLLDAARPSSPGAAPALFVAVTESGLSNAVTAGENRGERLSHDHVVRVWTGPLPLASKDQPAQRIDLPAAGNGAAGSALVAFVQDQSSGEVLQAVQLDLTRCGR